MKAKLLLMLALVAGLAVEAKAFTYTSTNYVSTNPPPSALRELPIGSLDKVLTYCTDQINNIDLHVLYENTESNEGVCHDGKYWKQYVNGLPCLYDGSEPLSDFIKRKLRDHLNKGLAAGCFVPVKPEAPEEQWFMAGAYCFDGATLYVVDTNTRYRGSAVIMLALNQFRLVKNLDGTFSIPEKASSPDGLTPFNWEVETIMIPGVKDIWIRAIVDGHELLYKPLSGPCNNRLYIHPTKMVTFPEQFALGEYDGTVTVYYSEDKTLYADYDLRTGAKIRDTFPPRLTLVGNKDGKRLFVEGGSGTLRIETSRDCREWNALRVVENYTGYVWLDGFLGYGDTLFYRVYVE